MDAGYADGIATGYMDPEIIRAYEPALVVVHRGLRIAVGCGDKRPPTEASIAFVNSLLPDDTAPIDDAYAGVFGAMLGEAAGIAGAGIKKHGPGFLRVHGGVEGIKDAIYEMRGKRSTLHSDDVVEGHSAHFAFKKSSSEVGCFYNGAYGEIMHNGARRDRVGQHIRTVAAENMQLIFGDANGIDQFFDGFRVILNEIDYGKRFSFDRNKYAAQIKRGTPAVILEHGHGPPTSNGVLVNMHVDRVGSPRVIREQNVPRLYRNDLARVAYEIGTVLRYFDVDPEDFLKTTTAETTLVRATLAERTFGIADPRIVPLGVVGSARQAIRTLNKS